MKGTRFTWAVLIVVALSACAELQDNPKRSLVLTFTIPWHIRSCFPFSR